METYITVDGDLLEANADFICHQVNCQGKMGSGVAKAIRNKHENVYVEYLRKCNEHSVDTSELLGEIQIIALYEKETPVPPYYCINMFAQNYYGYDGKQYTNLDAFKKCLEKINEQCRGYRVAFPWLIGCVRGGADWNTILPMILDTLKDVKEIQFYKL